MTNDTAKTGEVVPYQLPVTGSTITNADWVVTGGATITTQVDLPASSTVLVSFPAAGKYKLTGTITCANGACLIGVITIVVQNP